MEIDLLNELGANLSYHFSDALNKPLAKPHWVFISVSHKCNFNCKMCGVKKVLKEEQLDLSVLKKVLDEVADWKSDCTVLLTGGEIFLREDIFEIIDYSVSKGLKTEIVSNGSLVDDGMAKRIVGSGLSNVAISLDGVNPETHDDIRGVKGAHKKALDAIKSLSRQKKISGSGPQISAWVTIMDLNLDELSGIAPLAKDMGVECLVYHPVIVAQDDMQNTINEGSLWINKKRISIFKKEISEIISYQKKNGLVAFLHDPYLWLDYFNGTLSKKDWKCNPFIFIDIGPDGEVRSCGPSFGNIKEMSLTDCLNTAHAGKARDRMKRCQKPCLQTCWSRPEADSLIGIIENFIAEVEGRGMSKDVKKTILDGAMALLGKYEDLVLETGADGR